MFLGSLTRDVIRAMKIVDVCTHVTDPPTRAAAGPAATGRYVASPGVEVLPARWGPWTWRPFPAYRERPHAVRDTTALAIIYAAHRLAGHSPSTALTFTVARMDTVRALAVLDADGSLLVSRHGLPLPTLRTSTGLYFSSGELTGSPLIPEHYTWQLAGGHDMPAGVC